MTLKIWVGKVFKRGLKSYKYLYMITNIFSGNDTESQIFISFCSILKYMKLLLSKSFVFNDTIKISTSKKHPPTQVTKTVSTLSMKNILTPQNIIIYSKLQTKTYLHLLALYSIFQRSKIILQAPLYSNNSSLRHFRAPQRLPLLKAQVGRYLWVRITTEFTAVRNRGVAQFQGWQPRHVVYSQVNVYWLADWHTSWRIKIKYWFSSHSWRIIDKIIINLINNLFSDCTSG